MPDEPSTETPVVETPTPEPDPPAEPETPAPKPPETVDFWKAKAREQEKRAKDNAAKAAQFDKFTEDQKTEQQKLTERAETAERERDALRSAREIDDWKVQVSKKSGVPADVLRGMSLEDIEEHAASLKALLPEPRKPGQVPGEGRTVTPGTGDPATQFAELIRNARK